MRLAIGRLSHDVTGLLLVFQLRARVAARASVRTAACAATRAAVSASAATPATTVNTVRLHARIAATTRVHDEMPRCVHCVCDDKSVAFVGVQHFEQNMMKKGSAGIKSGTTA